MKQLLFMLVSMLLCLSVMAQEEKALESEFGNSEAKMCTDIQNQETETRNSEVEEKDDNSNSDEYNYQLNKTLGILAKKHGRNFMALSVIVGGNVDFLSGPGAEGFDPGLGFSAGASWDILYNSNFGVELGAYYHNYGIGWGTSANDHHWSSRLSYFDFQLILDPRVFFSDNSSIEANIGLGYNLGFDSPIKYKGHKIDGVYMFGEKGVLKDQSVDLLLGMTYRFSEGFIRLIYHHGMSNLNKKTADKVTLCNFELALGFTWDSFLDI